MVLSSPEDNKHSLYSRLCPSSWEWYMTYSVWDWNLQPTIYTTLGLLCKKIPSSPVWIVICFCLHLWLCNGPLNCPQSTPPSPKDCWDWLKPSHDSEKDGAPIIWMNDWMNSVLATVWKCFKETHSTINALQTSVRGLSKSKNVKVLKHFSACMRKTPFKYYWAKSDFFIFNVVTGHYFIHLCLLFCFIQVWRLTSTLCLPPPRLSQLPILPSPPSGEPHILSGPYSSMHSALHALFLFPETDLILGFLSLGGVMVVGSFTVGAVVFTVVIGCPGVCHYQQLLDVTLYKYKKEKKKRGRAVRLLCQQHWCQHLSQTEITGWKIFTPAEKGL